MIGMIWPFHPGSWKHHPVTGMTGDDDRDDSWINNYIQKNCAHFLCDRTWSDRDENRDENRDDGG